MNTQLTTKSIRKSLTISMTIMLTLVIWLPFVGSAMAQEDRGASGKDAATTSLPKQGPTDPAEMEVFLDDLLAQEMEDYHIAGAAVAVVKDGELFFAKGYGYADLENQIPVDPEQTVFRIGSVGKTLTWTAVMQLVEEGKLDLDADVNTYLDFRIPDTYTQPITLKHLLTHTSGFEERWIGSVVSDASEAEHAREWLIAHMAARMRPPGECIAYSNYNAMLAGYIVSQVSGQPYDEYIQEHIFDPLGMVHSSAQVPMSPDLRVHASLGYNYVDDAFQVAPDFTPQPALVPSGGHQASVTDMARFMIAHLQDGRYSDANIPEARILEEATAQQMHSTQYTPDPRLPGITYGFFDFSDNGQRTIGHSGYAGTVPMHSLLLLLPDQNLGVFVAYNSAGGGAVNVPFFEFGGAFFDHYYPAPAVEPTQPPAGFAERASQFVGSYRQTEFPYTSFQKVGAAFGGMTAEVSDSGDGTLLLPTPYGEMRFAEVEPLYFRQVDGPFHLVFQEDDQGRITRMFVDFLPHTAFDKLAWYETSGFNMVLLLGCVLIFLSIVPAGVIRLVRNRRAGGDRKPISRGARLAHWIILGICILNLLILAGIAWGANGGIPNELAYPPLIIQITLGLGVLSAALTVAPLVYTVLAWKNTYWGVAARTYYTLVTVAAVAFVWFLNYWNLLGLRY